MRNAIHGRPSTGRAGWRVAVPAAAGPWTEEPAPGGVKWKRRKTNGGSLMAIRATSYLLENMKKELNISPG